MPPACIGETDLDLKNLKFIASSLTRSNLGTRGQIFITVLYCRILPLLDNISQSRE